jgi:peroxiredoxin
MLDSLKTANFAIVAVAEESRGSEHARPWIEQANATYWCLIDVDHRVASLYGMVNLPQCVWIDEAGQHRPTAGDDRIDRSFPSHASGHAHDVS